MPSSCRRTQMAGFTLSKSPLALAGPISPMSSRPQRGSTSGASGRGSKLIQGISPTSFPPLVATTPESFSRWRQEHPDTSAYTDAEIVYRVTKYHHAGFILKSHSYERIQQLLDSYARRFQADFLATQ